MKTIEVRCCCDAHLVGWLPAHGEPELGRIYVYVVGEVFKPGLPDDSMIETLPFQCDVMTDPYTRDTWLALKSRDYPLEQLRRIPDFRENLESSET